VVTMLNAGLMRPWNDHGAGPAPNQRAYPDRGLGRRIAPFPWGLASGVHPLPRGAMFRPEKGTRRLLRSILTLPKKKKPVRGGLTTPLRDRGDYAGLCHWGASTPEVLLRRRRGDRRTDALDKRPSSWNEPSKALVRPKHTQAKKPITSTATMISGSCHNYSRERRGSGVNGALPTGRTHGAMCSIR